MKRKLLSMTVALLCAVGTWAQGTWTAPSVPGADLSTVDGSTIYYLYNVGSDAFVTYGMNWGSQATARRLSSGDQAASAIHRLTITTIGSQLRFHLSDNKYADRFLSDNGGANNCYVDTYQGDNNDATSILFSYAAGTVSGAYNILLRQPR